MSSTSAAPDRKTITREELFARVWAAPATEVARELGVSDVYLGKLCRQLQVPKPPRGYWARIQAGKAKRLPPLPAFKAETFRLPATKKSATGETTALLGVSAKQAELLSRALREIEAVSGHPTHCKFGNRVCYISSELAAQATLLIQSQWKSWISENLSSHGWTAAAYTAKRLIDKLLPLAKPPLIIFRALDANGKPSDSGPTALIFLTADWQRRIGATHKLLDEHQLAYVAAPLPKNEHTWQHGYLGTPSQDMTIRGELCISRKELWIRGHYRSEWHAREFESERFELATLIPVDLITADPIELPKSVAVTALKPYAKRLKALKEIEKVYEAIVSDGYDMERAIPSERLILADLLWFGRDGVSPFQDARRAWAEIESQLDNWDRILEQERKQLAESVLGIRPGDTVVFRDNGRITRILVDYVTCWSYDEAVSFQVGGRRFRKDGVLGKRDEVFRIYMDEAKKDG